MIGQLEYKIEVSGSKEIRTKWNFIFYGVTLIRFCFGSCEVYVGVLLSFNSQDLVANQRQWIDPIFHNLIMPHSKNLI